MGRMNEDQRWAAMLWMAHTHARGGDLGKANALLDLVQVQARARSDAGDGAGATSALHAAIELRRSLREMARP